ncbi:hypothetical protein [Pedobacter metabolipauper]|uniref:GLPGLI family protein n=1 Tax=Pedobacter metabolipauper TaxID=425513 RepID=A0A4R6SSD7_9SPHI|nr:hypothetical protein [Pedobacter metabolipauper]TDQ06691.1 hypothetical protein ATK78_4350 [Pedobacter metabolipauper]
MRKKLSALLVLIIVFIHVKAQTNEVKGVVKAFEDYKYAILNDKGAEAADLIDSHTINYYQEMIDLVKKGDSSTVDRLPVIDKMTVFYLRHITKKEDLLKMDGKRLFIYSIDLGMISKSSVAGTTIGKVTVEKDFAKGMFLFDGKESPYYSHFYKEKGMWKVNLTAMYPFSNEEMKKAIVESGIAENEYLFKVLESMSGKKPGKEIWEKLLQE